MNIRQFKELAEHIEKLTAETRAPSVKVQLEIASSRLWMAYDECKRLEAEKQLRFNL